MKPYSGKDFVAHLYHPERIESRSGAILGYFWGTQIVLWFTLTAIGIGKLCGF